MGIRFQSPSGSIDESRIASLERNLGATLPADFRNFLLGHNDFSLDDPAGEDNIDAATVVEDRDRAPRRAVAG